MPGASGGGSWFSDISGWFSGIFKSIKGMFSGIFSLFTDIFKWIFGGISSLFGGIFHGGGISQSPYAMRHVSAFAFAGAPRYAEGFYPGEYPAILHKNEAVIPLSGGRYVPVQMNGEKEKSPVNITIHEAPGTKAKVEEDSQGNINVIIEQVESAMTARMNRGTGLASYLDGRYRRRM